MVNATIRLYRRAVVGNGECRRHASIYPQSGSIPGASTIHPRDIAGFLLGVQQARAAGLRV